MKRFTLPLAWITATALIAVSAAVEPALLIDETPYNAEYYVIYHWHYFVSMIAAGAFFAAAYSIVAITAQSSLVTRLGWAHFAVMFTGLAMIFWPGKLIFLAGGPRRYHDATEVFTLANGISSAGYAVTLVGLAIFVCILAVIGWRSASRLRRKRG